MHRIAPKNMIWLPGGTFLMGSDRHRPEEAPAYKVGVDGFFMDIHPVTNGQFSRFVEDTGHTTQAEIEPRAQDHSDALPEILRPGSLVFRMPPSGKTDVDDPLSCWEFCFGADWRHPTGPGSGIEGLDDHPVVHVCYADAQAYARWASKEIPTEAEWEFAAKAGVEHECARDTELTPMGSIENTAEDGFAKTSSVRAYPPNEFGLFDMIGNVWEWTSDFWASQHNHPRTPFIPRNPRNTNAVDSCLLFRPSGQIPRRVLKGASHLCAPNYRRRYWPSARHPQPVDSSTSHIGFRCVLRPLEGHALQLGMV